MVLVLVLVLFLVWVTKDLADFTNRSCISLVIEFLPITRKAPRGVRMLSWELVARVYIAANELRP